MNKHPSVSVVTTTLNQAGYLRETLESVFAQTYQPLEIVLVDDGSTDGTPELARSFGERVRYIRQPNAGVAASRNTGVAAAAGDLIALMDGDDLWHPEKIAAQVEAFRRHPKAGMVVVDLDQFDSSGVRWPSVLSSLRQELGPQRSSVDDGSMYADLLHGNWIATTSSVMIRADVLRAVGPSDASFPVANDYDLYLRIAERYDIALIRTVLVYWRYLSTSASGPQAERSWRWGSDVLRVLTKHAGKPGVNQPALREARARAATRAMRSVSRREGETGRLRALRRLCELNRIAPTVNGLGFLLLTATPRPIRNLGSAAVRSLRRLNGTADAA